LKVSGFTFIKNGETLGYPFLESIKSVLPIVDEFVIAVGQSQDKTLEKIKSIKSKKIRIIQSIWNEKMHDRGFVYAQQKMVAQFNTTGDWAFYLEGDEVIHENDLAIIFMAHLVRLVLQDIEGLQELLEILLGTILLMGFFL